MKLGDKVTLSDPIKFIKENKYIFPYGIITYISVKGEYASVIVPYCFDKYGFELKKENYVIHPNIIDLEVVND